MKFWWLCAYLWSLGFVCEAKYYHMAYAGYRKDDPTTETVPTDEDQDRMGILYRAPSIYQPSYYHHAPPIVESAEVESFPLESYSDPGPPPSAPMTEAPPAAPAAPSEKRQQPYSYYYIGRKLWYIPLYFSLYFVIYVASLIIRAITRHKITFPDRLPQGKALEDRQGSPAADEKLDLQTANLNKMLDDLMLKYM